MDNYIKVEDIDVPHMFLKKHITFILSDRQNYNDFYEEFQEYFLDGILSVYAKGLMRRFLQDEELEQKEKAYLINNLRRVFSNKEHFKGLVGEYMFAFYFSNLVDDWLWSHGPKGRSSAEPGIDYITFNGNSHDKNSIRVTVWETKTTEKTISSRASQVYDFFSENGSLDENIDVEIDALTALFESQDPSPLKEVVADLYTMFINKDKRFCIGVSAVSSKLTSTENTFRNFANCYHSYLGKEQRLVNFIFVELLKNIMDDLRENIWTRLQN